MKYVTRVLNAVQYTDDFSLRTILQSLSAELESSIGGGELVYISGYTRGDGDFWLEVEKNDWVIWSCREAPFVVSHDEYRRMFKEI